MDSPSLESPEPRLPADRESDAGEPCRTVPQGGRSALKDTVVVVGFGNPVAADYAEFVGRNSRGDTVLVADEAVRRLVEAPVRALSMGEFLRSSTYRRDEPSLVLFIGSRLTGRERGELDDLLEAARRWQTRFVGVVGSFRVHLDDPDVANLEDEVLSRAERLGARVVVFRPGHVLSRRSEMAGLLQRIAPLHPLIPGYVRSCFIEGTELFHAIEAERLDDPPRPDAEDSWNGTEPGGRAVGGRDRAFTLLGANRPWREMLARYRSGSPRQSVATAVSGLLSWLLVGHLFAMVLALLARPLPRMRQWVVHTLKPRSLRELISLCHRRNVVHVKVVGYNNGVVHFGHRYPGKTIVSTIHCRRLARSRGRTLKADCGATIRGALDFLASNQQELYVVPNYSYVCLGTAFFVPIHGSAVDFSTVADTICRVVLYDPEGDRIVSAARGDVDFIENVYNLDSRVVVLRVYLLAKPKSRYFVHHQTLKTPSAAELLDALRDREATNVEIRQAHAASATVRVSRYYNDLGETSAPALELPRDALGRLWDRLEENPLTSYLMHAVGRHVVWHAELFFTPQEFALFWETHDRLPLRKLQLRFIRRDGLAHSPFRDEDCVSIDLFMFRRHRYRFQEYLTTTFPNVRTNPGKHSN
jgi:hypothetical protein